MTNFRLSQPRMWLLAACASLLLNPTIASAQGAAGGSLGNDNKSLSGAREPSRSATPARRAKPARAERTETRRAPAPRRSAGNFDGAWTATASAGCAASGTGSLVISGGTLAGQGISGSVSPNGAVRAVGNANGISVVSSGRLSGNTGSGSYRQSDGCTGTWRAMRN